MWAPCCCCYFLSHFALRQVFGRVLVRVLVVVTMWTVALTFPFFGNLMSFLGGSSGIPIILILPLAIDWQLHSSSMGTAQNLLYAALLAGSIAFAAIVTVKEGSLMLDMAWHRVYGDAPSPLHH